jgi:hypothetical protein
MSGPGMAKKAKKANTGGNPTPLLPTFSKKKLKEQGAFLNKLTAPVRGLIGGMNLGSKASNDAELVAKVPTTIGRAVKAAGMSLLKDYRGSGLQQRFEGTPITVETKFETEASPFVKRPRTSTGRKAAIKRGTIKYTEK